MTAWNEAHYARGREFLRLIADAVPPTRPVAIPAPAPAQNAQTPPRAEITPAAPLPAAPETPAAPAPRPSAASVFKKIPWKK